MLRCSRRALLCALALAAVLSACKVDATVAVTVRENGSGVVRVVVRADAEAVKAAESGGVAIDKAVRLSDVADAGFRVGTWHKAKDGSATVVISRPFRNVSEVDGIVSALNGADGPLPVLKASRSRGLIATDYGVKGRIDVDKVTTGVNDDKELLTRLQALGVDVAAIDKQLLAQVRSSFSLKVIVRLPDQKPVTFTPKKGTNAATVDSVVTDHEHDADRAPGSSARATAARGRRVDPRWSTAPAAPIAGIAWRHRRRARTLGRPAAHCGTTAYRGTTRGRGPAARDPGPTLPTTGTPCFGPAAEAQTLRGPAAQGQTATGPAATGPAAATPTATAGRALSRVLDRDSRATRRLVAGLRQVRSAG